jgi:hypothetical protein
MKNKSNIETQGAVPVGSGDLLGITVIAIRDLRNIIGNAVNAEIRKRGLKIISRKDYYRLIGDEKAAAAIAQYREPNRGHPRPYHPNR